MPEARPWPPERVTCWRCGASAPWQEVRPGALRWWEAPRPGAWSWLGDYQPDAFECPRCSGGAP